MMKFRQFLLIVIFLSLSYPAMALNVTINRTNVALEVVLSEIAKQSDHIFNFSIPVIDLDQKVSLNVNKRSLEDVLSLLLTDLNIEYRIGGKNIYLMEAEGNNLAAQQAKKNDRITGVVTDATGDVIPGSTILVQGTRNATSTDIDGKFSIDAETNDVLEISFIGYVAQEIKIGNRRIIQVTLEEDTELLDEVLVVGYGVQRKSDLTGSVESVKTDMILRQPVMEVSQALAGLVPGLTAAVTSGAPGSEATLLIRGTGSMSASSAPLILIDGISSSISNIDANDIESMTVLKDAGSAAIYGSRASNGVILITTKRGKAGKAIVSFSSHVGVQALTDVQEFLGAIDHLRATGNDALLEQYLANPDDKENFPDTNWPDLLFSESGLSNYQNINISGGTETARTRASITHKKQNGNVPFFSNERLQMRINNDFKLFDKINVQVDFDASRVIKKTPEGGTEIIGGAFGAALPTDPHMFSNGKLAMPPVGSNPYAQLHEGGYQNTITTNLKGFTKVDYSPLDGLKLSASYGFIWSDALRKIYQPQYELYSSADSETPIIISQGTNAETELNMRNSNVLSQNVLATINYIKDLGKHHIDAILGYELYKVQSENFDATRYNFSSSLEVLNAGNQDNDSNSGTATHSALVSFFARFNYSYDNRYMIALSLRRDGSSRFAPESRWGYFPAVSVGWNIHNEEFFPKNSFVTNLKIRGSWGQLGNQSIGSEFPYAALISIGTSYYADDMILQGASQSIMANRAISWETGETLNFGIDFGLFEGRLSGSVEYYKRDTRGLLGLLQIPSSLGLSSPNANVYSMRNSGVDFSLMWRHHINDFNYNLGVNFATVENEVTDLNGLDFIKTATSINQVGYPVGSIIGYESIGMFRDQAEIDEAPKQFGKLTPGDIRFKDQLTIDTDGDGMPDQADGVITADDRVILGSPIPKVTFGANIYLGYKGFDLSMRLQGAAGHNSHFNGSVVYPYFNGAKIQKWQQEEAWTPENLDAKFPVIKSYSQASNNYNLSSTYVFDASYLRIKNITFGYTFPRFALGKARISNLRIYVTGQNLFTFDHLPSGIDPETRNTTGPGRYPMVKTYALGLNVTF